MTWPTWPSRNGKSIEEMDDDFEAALSLRDRYERLWNVLHQDVTIHPDKRYRVDRAAARHQRAGLRGGRGHPRAGRGRHWRTCACAWRWPAATTHSRRLRQLTGIEAGEGQSAILLNDLTAWAGMGWAGDW